MVMTTSSYGNLPKLSVIMVVRNAATSVGRALDSLAAQHYPKLEVIVWDGLSNDGTQEVLSRYSGFITTLVSEKDNGPPDACNRALAFVTGDYIGYLNADDEFEPGMLWAVAEAILQRPQTDVVSTGILYRLRNREGKGIVTGYYAGEDQLALTLENVLSGLPTFYLSRFIRRELALKVGGFNTDPALWYISNDREWMARLVLTACSNVVIPRALYGFNINTSSFSSNPENFTRIVDEHLLMADSLLKREDLTQAQRAALRGWQMRQFSLGFWKALAALRWDKAREYARGGIRAGGWRWGPFSLWLLAAKLSRRFGLLLSKGIDRGETR
jgi:glycosyltransferase involved in cell wall biosynthesis